MVTDSGLFSVQNSSNVLNRRAESYKLWLQVSVTQVWVFFIKPKSSDPDRILLCGVFRSSWCTKRRSWQKLSCSMSPSCLGSSGIRIGAESRFPRYPECRNGRGKKRDLWLLADCEFLCNSPFKPSLSGAVETHLNLKRSLHTSPASRHQTSGAYKLVSFSTTWAPCHIGVLSPNPYLPHFYLPTLYFSFFTVSLSSLLLPTMSLSHSLVTLLVAYFQFATRVLSAFRCLLLVPSSEGGRLNGRYLIIRAPPTF